ncbi:MAG: amidophosphoribosyltransferase [Bacteroidetes bacterium GWF2_43_63]|nr:MAG: amidophosphoribosyltransferase [Bacteroidetes bacterium GWE2_42_42]OFY54047.1 MAG: amidophosphoribosyltransferase [Bacteroidetes bacterium GWF2_43_63]HCB63543.1 amidophosphoribosyltransferase [Bacteroidales bacterium]HCY23211.1 amidophosphoribosyltransferase [Bacteroidales bacterium]
MSGFFGSVSLGDCVNDVFYGTDYHSHLGTKRAGLAFYSKEAGFQRAIHSIENGYFRNKFEDEVADFKGHIGIGVISDTEAQPVVMTSHLGRFAVASVSKIANIQELENRCIEKQLVYSEMSMGRINPTELVAKLIAEETDFVSGIRNVQELIKGSCSLMVMTPDGIYVGRDKLGRTPIVIGKKGGAFAATFETCAFPNLGYETFRYLGPGEIGKITADGYTMLKEPNDKMQVCAFLWVYYGFPTSSYEGINVDECRHRCGAALAKNDDVEVDFVAGIPDSGVGHATGYSNFAHIPYKRPYSKYTPTWPRSFMPQSQAQRDLVATMKLIPNTAVIKDQSGVFLDDSIVRGTQLKDNVKDLRKAGIKQVHMRIACPPLTYPCLFLNFSRSRSNMDLATYIAMNELEGKEERDMAAYSNPDSEEYKQMVDRIRIRLGLDSLKFQRLEDLIDAIGLPKEKVCTHCFNGSSYF